MATTIAAPAGPNWLTPGPTQVFAAGYVFTLEAIGHLCVMAYGLSEETVRQLGPLCAADWYFGSNLFFDRDSPQFLPVGCSACRHLLSDPRPDIYMLTSRLAFVGPGMKPPKLPLDEETERFVDVWYPPSIRELEQFSDVHYRKMCHAAHHEDTRLITEKRFDYLLKHESGVPDQGLSNSAAMCAKRTDEEGNPHDDGE